MRYTKMEKDLSVELLNYCDMTLSNIAKEKVYSLEIRLLLQSRNSFPCKDSAILAVEALWERIHLDKWSDVNVTVRQQYTVAAALRAASLLSFTPIDYISVLDALDRALLFGDGRNETIGKAASVVHSLLPIQTVDLPASIVTFENQPPCDIPRKKQPSLQWFRSNALTVHKPMILTNCIEHWPARTHWSNFNHFMKLASYRLIPVEVGSDYMDESWTQRLLPLGEYFREFVVPVKGKRKRTDGKFGYMAQHELFDQIHELKKDIITPDYCALTRKQSAYAEEESDVTVNAWIGPSGTKSRLHHDNKENLLAQVVGRKRIVLIAPKYNTCVYPYEGMMNNTSRVDVCCVDEGRFPLFKNAEMMEVKLMPGEM